MKKELLMKVLLLTGVLGFIFSGCQKDGDYRPKEKIKEYTEKQTSISEGEEKDFLTKTEQWHWDGDLLSRIDLIYAVGEAPERTYPSYFEYDNNQLIKITDIDGHTLNFTYDGRRVEKLEYRVANSEELIYSETYTHKNGKIIEIDVKALNMLHFKNLSKNISLLSILDGMRPNLPISKMTSDDGNNKSEYLYSTITIEWKGDNISKTTTVFDDGIIEVAEYSYDDMLNPFYRSLEHFIGGEALASKNNVISQTWSNSYESARITTYAYAYDGKYPTTKKREYDTTGMAYVMTLTAHYEYE